MSLLTADELAIEYGLRGRSIRSLDGASLSVERGEIVGVVGESGSGKSTLGLAAGRLLPSNAVHVGGDLHIDGASIWSHGPKALRELRATKLGFVFQSPLASLDPTMRIGRQLTLVLRRHGLDTDLAPHLDRVGLSDAERVARSYPHELSGGMAQRVAVALALAPEPELIVADEPTASLDSTVRVQVLDVLLERVRAVGATLMLLSHDLQTIRRHCTRVVVMYGGRIVEDGTADEVLDRSVHPYTKALLRAAPGLERPGERISAIDGSPPVLAGASAGCAFEPRCGWATDECATTRPDARLVGERIVLCHRADAVEAGEPPSRPARGERGERGVRAEESSRA